MSISGIMRLPVTSSITPFEQPEIENMGIAVGILLMCALELRDMMSATNDNERLGYFRFVRRHIGFLECGVRPISIASCIPNIFRKSHESAFLGLWRFQSSGDESGRASGQTP